MYNLGSSGVLRIDKDAPSSKDWMIGDHQLMSADL